MQLTASHEPCTTVRQGLAPDARAERFQAIRGQQLVAKFERIDRVVGRDEGVSPWLADTQCGSSCSAPPPPHTVPLPRVSQMFPNIKNEKV